MSHPNFVDAERFPSLKKVLTFLEISLDLVSLRTPNVRFAASEEYADYSWLKDHKMFQSALIEY
jgi:hypothetical protein